MSPPLCSTRFLAGVALAICLLPPWPRALYGDDPPTPAGSVSAESVRWSAGLDLSVDREGAFLQRSTLDIDSVRTVWWSAGETVLVREEPAPAGMVERSYRVHNPFASVTHRVGVSGGPVIFGPALPRGGYARLGDPSRGGVVPSGVWNGTRLVLDRALEPTTREGVAVAGGTGGAHGGAGYLFAPDRSHVLLSHGRIAPRSGRFGAVEVCVATAEALTRGRPRDHQPDEDPWLYDTPPSGPGIRRTLATSYRFERGGYGDPLGRWRVPVSLFAEGTTQGFSYLPRKRAFQGAWMIGPPVVRWSGRAVWVEPGYLDTDLASTDRAELAGVRLDGRSRFGGERIRPRGTIEWLAEAIRERRWDEGIPGDPVPSGRGSVTLRTGEIIETIGASVELPGPDRSGELGFSTGERISLGTFALRVGGSYEEESRRSRLSGEVIFRRHAGGAVGTGAIEMRWRVVVETTGSEREFGVEHSVSAEIPLGGAWTLSVRGTGPGCVRSGAEWEGAIRVRWYRSGEITAGGSGAPTGNRSSGPPRRSPSPSADLP